MILSEKLISLIQKISNLELKEEEKIKWQSAYLEIFEKGYFIINRDNLEKLLTMSVVETPLTTYGEIVLIKHIKRVHLDNRQLAKTIEIAVRFLDGCLDVINFSIEARDKISKFRKIGLGIADFDAYCVQSNQEQTNSAYVLGDLISNAAYRASENLGAEKGFIPNIEDSKSYNKGKIFAKYLIKTNGSFVSGYQLKKMVIENAISSEDYEVVPRRNSHILLLPNQEIWYPFTDRVDGDYIPMENNQGNNNVSNNKNITEQTTLSKFAKGELVQVFTDKEDRDSVFQITNIKTRNGLTYYTLKGQQKKYNKNSIHEVLESELRSVDISYVLDKLNMSEDNKTKNNSVLCIILNGSDDMVLIDKNTQQPPRFTLSQSDTPEIHLINSLQEKYNIKSEILDEIGSAVEDGSIMLAYWVNIVDGSIADLSWVSIKDLSVNNTYNKVFQKLYRKKKIFQQYENIIDNLEKDKETLFNEKNQMEAKSVLVVHERAKANLSIRERINLLFGARPSRNYLRLSGEQGQNRDYTKQDFDYDDRRFLLSLQQNIITDDFGNVKIIMEYSKEGIKSIQIYPEHYSADERFLLDLYLELINMGLQYGVRKEDFLFILNKYTTLAEKAQLIEIVKIIRQSLSTAPNSFEELSKKVY
jgi:hypothetical protein